MLVEARLLKAARVLLRWSQEELAKKAGIGRTTLSKVEAGEQDVRLSTIRAVQQALEDGGIKFVAADDVYGVGVRLRQPDR